MEKYIGQQMVQHKSCTQLSTLVVYMSIFIWKCTYNDTNGSEWYGEALRVYRAFAVP